MSLSHHILSLSYHILCLCSILSLINGVGEVAYVKQTIGLLYSIQLCYVVPIRVAPPLTKLYVHQSVYDITHTIYLLAMFE